MTEAKKRKPVDPKVAEQVDRYAKRAAAVLVDTAGITFGWDVIAPYFGLPVVGPWVVLGILLLLVCLKAEVMGVVRSR
jgi:hypothetical protein